jgi:DNA-binding response OmpR family regulator
MNRILVIEDDTDYRLMLKDTLEEAGYEVLDAPDGEAGLRLFRQQPCVLVITDIFMPEKDGIETILELKKEFPTVKIIAISGGGLHARYYEEGAWVNMILETAKEFGANHILHKPIKLEHLLALVDEFLRDS